MKTTTRRLSQLVLPMTTVEVRRVVVTMGTTASLPSAASTLDDAPAKRWTVVDMT